MLFLNSMWRNPAVSFQLKSALESSHFTFCMLALATAVPTYTGLLKGQSSLQKAWRKCPVAMTPAMTGRNVQVWLLNLSLSTGTEIKMCWLLHCVRMGFTGIVAHFSKLWSEECGSGFSAASLLTCITFRYVSSLRQKWYGHFPLVRDRRNLKIKGTA